jgi:preprotein translocase subunit SecY
MAEEKKSFLYKLKPIIDKMPAIKKPDGHVHFRTKMMWTFGILILYFAMTNVLIYGLSADSIDTFSEFRAILAGASGSIMHLGIGPIVTGSIIMQLFTGAKIIKLDLQDAHDKAIYQGTQKVMVLIMIAVEAVPQVFGYLEPDGLLIDKAGGWPLMSGLWWARLVIIVQLFFGSYMVFLMDEIISKWGIGSGISMFIAAGVSQAIFTGTFNWEPADTSTGSTLSVNNPPTGTLFKTHYLWTHMSSSDLIGGGFERMFLGQPNPIIALMGTIVIFFIVAYAESARIELPIASEKARGARGRYPIRLIYASNIPVILMAALLANINMFSLLLYTHPTLRKFPFIGKAWWIGKFDPGETRPSAGGAWYLTTINGVHEWLLPLIDPTKYEVYMYDHAYWQVMLRVIVYLVVMVAGSIAFGKFWIETTNMGPEAVAKQIHSSGMQIPGFRRSPKSLKVVLMKYIPQVTILSSAFVGLLAAVANMIGTVGQTSGTGVLLTVGIMIRLYEQIGKEQMVEMHPVLRGFFGEE